MSVDGKTKVLGLLGDPVGHTLSPEIHECLAEAVGQNTVYVPFRVPASALKEAVEGVRALGIAGFNVTVPHKVSVVPFLDGCSEEARMIGAVNAVRREGERLIGHNTDGEGWKRSLLREGVCLQGCRAVIFGAGGAARGIGVTLAQSGAEAIYIVNRTRERGEKLAEDLRQMGANATMADGALPEGIDLAVNTTGVGMFPDPDRAVTGDFSFMKRSGTVCDAVYAPRETLFLQRAKEAGLRTVGGIGMLIMQAVLSYEFFTGTTVPEEAADALYRRLSFPRNIVLTGFMGSGKTTVGKCLAEKYSLAFADTDREIEAREGMKISEIFARKGEARFRAAEREVIREFSSRSGWVLSLGGGAVLSEENRALLKENGLLIYLKTSPETVIQRVGNDPDRPLLYGKSEAEIRALSASREAAYRDADASVTTDGKNPGKIVSEIVEIILTKGGKS